MDKFRLAMLRNNEAGFIQPKDSLLSLPIVFCFCFCIHRKPTLVSLITAIPELVSWFFQCMCGLSLRKYTFCDES